MQSWVAEELATADLADKRLDKRFVKLLGQLSSKPNQSIPAACGTWADIQAAYRFFDNEKVTLEAILDPHHDATVKRCVGHPVVLVAQDTTELELTRPNEKVGGPLGDEKHWGFHAHPSLVMTPGQVPLGILHAHVWARDLDDFHKRLEAKEKPIEQKESLRWLEGYRRACDLQRRVSSRVVSLSDSEGDIYECFAARMATGEGPTADFIIRACQNRSLSSADPAYFKGDTTLLWRAAELAPVVGRRSVEVSFRPAQTGDGSVRRQMRSARTTKVTLRATTVTLKGVRRPVPGDKPSTRLMDVRVNVVLVREVNPPAGEPAIEWLLLTSLPVSTVGEIESVVDYYCCRWLIENYFMVVKSGCRVEQLQLETTERLMPCVAMYLIVAWRVLYLLRMGRESPEMSCEGPLLPEEWQSVWRVVKHEEPPKSPPSLGKMIKLIAQLGGYIPRRKEPPGPKTFWIGLQRMRDFALVWALVQPNRRPIEV